MKDKKSWGILILIGAIAVVILVYFLSRAKKEDKKQYYIPDGNGVIPDNGGIPYIKPETDFYCKRGDPCSVSDIEMKWDIGSRRLIYALTGKAYLTNHGIAYNRQMSVKADGIQIWQSSGTYGSGEESINITVGRDVRVFTFIGFRVRLFGAETGKCTIESLEAHLL
jgi:hypothetical protein